MTPVSHYEPVWLALRALPRDATDGERAMAAIKAMPSADRPVSWRAGLRHALVYCGVVATFVAIALGMTLLLAMMPGGLG